MSTREAGGKIERETRFYITSLALIARLIGPLIRDHWAVENSLHWMLDMVFRDDECRLRTDHKTYCAQSYTKSARQGFPAIETKSGRMGR